MPSIHISAESPQSEQLEKLVKEHISSFGIDDDVDFVAQYIVVMITNGKEQNSITEELVGLFGDKFNDEFSRWLFETANSIVNGEAGYSNQSSEMIENQQVQQSSYPVSAFAGNGSVFPNDVNINEQYSPSAMSNRFNPRPLRGGFKSNGGISKNSNYNSGTKIRGSSGFKRGGGYFNGQIPHAAGNWEIGAMGTGVIATNQVGGYEAENSMELGNANARPRPIMERCKNWPRCENFPCEYLHPSRPCKLYPRCPSEPGTCRFVHVGEDDAPPNGFKFQLPPPEVTEDFRQQHSQFLEEQKKLKAMGQQNQNLPPYPYPNQQPRSNYHIQKAPPIILCKFSDRCVNKACPCGHPTPANDNAKVTNLEWCSASKDCADASCDKAHPSGSVVRPPAPLPTEKVLETCKFGARCSNANCRYRHAISPVLCRDGAQCTRLDCMFTHPTEEMCYFGINCRKPNCRFKHPEGHLNKSTVWVKDQQPSNSTSERQFAESEDQIMETIIPGSEQPTEQAAN